MAWLRAAAGARNFSSQSRNGHENPGFLPVGLRKPLRQSAFVGARKLFFSKKRTGESDLRRNEKMRASEDWEIKRTRSIDKAAKPQDIREAFLLRKLTDNYGSGKVVGFGESIRDIANFNNNLFARLPSESDWIKSGSVERQTTATHVPWQHRVMILTSSHVIFSKSGSDTAVDQISLENITLIGAVEGEDELHVTAT